MHLKSSNTEPEMKQLTKYTKHSYIQFKTTE
jgi:hypothetical protein